MTFTITKPASMALKNALDQQPKQEGQVFRLDQDNNGDLRFNLDTEKPNDLRQEYKGQTVLVMQPTLAQKLTGQQLDFNESGQFVIYGEGASNS